MTLNDVYNGTDCDSVTFQLSKFVGDDFRTDLYVRLSKQFACRVVNNVREGAVSDIMEKPRCHEIVQVSFEIGCLVWLSRFVQFVGEHRGEFAR